MTHAYDEDVLLQIIEKYGNIAKLNKDINLIAEPMRFNARDMTAIFIDIERHFGVAPAALVPKVSYFTFHNIATALKDCL